TITIMVTTVSTEIIIIPGICGYRSFVRSFVMRTRTHSTKLQPTSAKKKKKKKSKNQHNREKQRQRRTKILSSKVRVFNVEAIV
ncbi:hypothetical protein DOY81_005209, partial [Sarcophaga bullata]